MEFTEYISAELYVLIPILYVIGAFIKNSKIKDWKIPLILGGVGICLAALWIFSTNSINNAQQVLYMIFASITQGILCAAAGVYTDNVYRQIKEKRNEQTDTDSDTSNNSVG